MFCDMVLFEDFRMEIRSVFFFLHLHEIICVVFYIFYLIVC